MLLTTVLEAGAAAEVALGATITADEATAEEATAGVVAAAAVETATAVVVTLSADAALVTAATAAAVAVAPETVFASTDEMWSRTRVVHWSVPT